MNCSYVFGFYVVNTYLLYLHLSMLEQSPLIHCCVTLVNGTSAGFYLNYGTSADMSDVIRQVLSPNMTIENSKVMLHNYLGHIVLSTVG